MSPYWYWSITSVEGVSCLLVHWSGFVGTIDIELTLMGGWLDWHVWANVQALGMILRFNWPLSGQGSTICSILGCFIVVLGWVCATQWEHWAIEPPTPVHKMSGYWTIELLRQLAIHWAVIDIDQLWVGHWYSLKIFIGNLLTLINSGRKFIDVGLIYWCRALNLTKVSMVYSCCIIFHMNLCT